MAHGKVLPKSMTHGLLSDGRHNDTSRAQVSGRDLSLFFPVLIDPNHWTTMVTSEDLRDEEVSAGLRLRGPCSAFDWEMVGDLENE